MYDKHPTWSLDKALDNSSIDSTNNSLIAKSVELIAAAQAPNGAYPASPTYNSYKYCWFRDGSFIADAMSRSGNIESAERFFNWCFGVIVGRREKINNGELLDARFNLDGQEVIDDWEPVQLDGFGTWLWALAGHTKRHQRSIDKYHEAIDLSVSYLVKNWRQPCYDWWEERNGIHAATLACIYAGLHAINHPEAETIKQAIDLNAERIDASLLICALLDAIEPKDFSPILIKIETALISPSGGVYRNLDDTYYGGGEWLLLTSMLGWYYQKIGRTEEAQQKLNWIIEHTKSNGWMPEQSTQNLVHPETYQSWVEKAGPPASPLLWSHAMFLTLNDVLGKLKS